MRVLVLVDLQYDFMPGGALAVPRGDEVVPVANRMVDDFELAVASQDWHPADHGSFASQHAGKKPGDKVDLDGIEQILWPNHCVQSTRGAAFHDELLTDRLDAVFQKGVDPRVDSYSAFFDNARKRSTGLEDYLRDRKVREVHILGLASDYCVKFTVLDAVDLGFRTFVYPDGCRGIGLNDGDIDQAWIDMQSAGATLMDLPF